MSVLLRDVIATLDRAYPPALAHSWDSVGLVCGDPAEAVESVTIAVDATAAVAASVPDGGLLLAHHPLLLRGVDTVAANTGKGALIHSLIRRGAALFSAHTGTRRRAAAVSDALAEALGLQVDGVLDPEEGRADLDKWVVFVPAAKADAVREAMFAAGGGQIGDYSHCSWTTSGVGQFLPHEGAAPAIGSVGTIEQVPEERVEVIAPSRLRRAVLAAMRAAHPYEEPAFDVLTLAPLPADVGIGRICSLPEPEPLSAFASRVARALPASEFPWCEQAAGVLRAQFGDALPVLVSQIRTDPWNVEITC
ncbi:Nif3-like dinuclear metal center hexameric protein [Mycolicibacterium sp. CBMA 361]|uniref:Nif3-like dinuclear metal center hexameric protein n=1 Tax=Mycolicibacterium sp. CBMA 361 TaxID=2606610 RepID=UPI0031BA73C4